MRRKYLVLLFVFIFLSPFSQTQARSIPPVAPTSPQIPQAPDLPETSGDYEVPGRPNMRLRVFAHPHAPPFPTKNNASPVVLPACTPDNNSSESVSLAGWHIKPGILTYRVNYTTVPSTVGGSSVAKQAIAQSFTTWDNLISSVTVQEGAVTSVKRARFDGQNAVFWNRLGSGSLAVSYMWYFPSTGELAEADLVYNNRYRWNMSDTTAACSGLNSYDVLNIGTHEVGHWFGLDDMYASSQVDLTMYGYAELGELKKRTLTSGDTSSVTSLY